MIRFEGFSFVSIIFFHRLYGKTLENKRKRTKITLVGTADALRRHVKKPTYKRHEIFSRDFVGVEKRLGSVLLDRPIYAGVAILDLSKVEMYKFHYQRMLPQYGSSRLRLLMTDTDSLVYHILTDDVYADMLRNRDDFDTSNYPADSPLFSSANAKRPGKMKDEMGGGAIRSFVGLRAKLYSIELGGGESIRRAKGIPRNVVRSQIDHADYYASLFGPAVGDVTVRSIQSRQHSLVTVERSRRALCSADDKRYIFDDNVRTYAYGHKDVPITNLLHEMLDTVEDSSGLGPLHCSCVEKALEALAGDDDHISSSNTTSDDEDQ